MTSLCLHHVGEIVLARLLDTLSRVDRLNAVECKLHAGCSLLSVLRSAGVAQPYAFAVNAKLAPTMLDGTSVRFDGAHGVDVLCHDTGHGVAIEAKLGVDRVSRREFTKRFLGPITLSTHKSARMSGSMTAILNYRGMGDRRHLALRTREPSVELCSPWFLVIRAATWRAWTSHCPDLSNAHVATFEDVARAHGDAAAFDRLVLETIGQGFHSAWNVSL